jgi:hypothetical protein
VFVSGRLRRFFIICPHQEKQILISPDANDEIIAFFVLCKASLNPLVVDKLLPVLEALPFLEFPFPEMSGLTTTGSGAVFTNL